MDEEPSREARLFEPKIVMSVKRTEEHAMELLVRVGERDLEGCRLTCKPTLVSCEPVGPCRQLNVPFPGCSPLECELGGGPPPPPTPQ